MKFRYIPRFQRLGLRTLSGSLIVIDRGEVVSEALTLLKEEVVQEALATYEKCVLDSSFTYVKECDGVKLRTTGGDMLVCRDGKILPEILPLLSDIAVDAINRKIPARPADISENKPAPETSSFRLGFSPEEKPMPKDIFWDFSRPIPALVFGTCMYRPGEDGPYANVPKEAVRWAVENPPLPKGVGHIMGAALMYFERQEGLVREKSGNIRFVSSFNHLSDEEVVETFDEDQAARIFRYRNKARCFP